MTDSYTIYTQPYLLFPRRIHAYLDEKPLPDAVNVNVVKIIFGENGMIDPPGKPKGSIPMMRIDSGPHAGTFIRQSYAIMEYFEDKYPRARDMRGSTPEERAAIRELITVIDETSFWFGMYVINACKMFEKQGQSEHTAKMGKQRMYLSKAKISDWAGEKVQKGNWLAGTDEPSLADCCMLALCEYAKAMFGIDFCNCDEVLQKWRAKWKGRKAGEQTEEKIVPEQYSMGKILTV
jgi:glutathione S-transferase